MPWKSKAQRGYMHANHPEIAARFDAETTKHAEQKLPAYVKKKTTKKTKEKRNG